MPLSFPGSLPETHELKFKDGKRTVAEYLFVLMSKYDTERYTYAETIDLINKGFIRDETNRAYDKMVREHFSDERS